MIESIPKISIIIPVYNTEKYISRCLDSVLKQTFNDFECIIVNDGSSDNSYNICIQYSINDKKFKVINQENKGTAIARDTGIKYAKGLFLTFIDSDDWIEPNTLELLYNYQKITDVDIVIGNYRVIDNNDTEGIPNIYINSNTYTEPIIYFFMSTCFSLCTKLYRRCLFNNYIIPDIKIGEDAIVNMQIFASISPGKFKTINEIIYNYDCRTNGVTSKIKNYYFSIFENPHILCRLWMEKYLINTKQPEAVFSAFSYNILLVIISIINQYKILKKQEMKFIYNNYYKNCRYLYLLNSVDCNFIYLCNISITIGKLYLFIMKNPIKESSYLKKIYNFKNRIIKMGLFQTIKYYKEK